MVLSEIGFVLFLISFQNWGGGFLAALPVKKPPSMRKAQEMWVRSLDQEDPLKKWMATHSSILAWRIPWTEEPGRLQFMDLQKSQTRRGD